LRSRDDCLERFAVDQRLERRVRLRRGISPHAAFRAGTAILAC
jgi:hypothetical protein